MEGFFNAIAQQAQTQPAQSTGVPPNDPAYRGMNLSYQPNTAGLNSQLPEFGSAAQTYADLTRSQWADYIRRFVPVENRLISYALSPEVVEANMAAAGEYAEQAYAQAPQMMERQMRGFGLQLTPDQQQAYDRQMNVSKGLATTQAMNAARDASGDRQMKVITGASGTPRESFAKQAGQA